MKISQINATCNKGSTGKICVSISRLLNKTGFENNILYCIGNTDYPLGRKYTDHKNISFGALSSRVLGNWGFEGKAATRNLIAELNMFQPDIVHLHNIHSHACNLQMLFEWIKEHHVKVVWTFHDCWAFTGYCMYYDYHQCNKWMTRCENCPQKSLYSFFFDNSELLRQKKEKLMNGVDLTIVTPSRWLADQVRMSHLSDCSITIINNGIDLGVFKPTNSFIKEKFKCQGKYVILGVASLWEKRKGIDVFIKLANMLNSQYQIVLVGTNDEIDKQLPPNIISIHRTHNQVELAEIYTAADVFVNPTLEDNYPTVNMEALACGTPVVTFNTGGSPEILDETCGIVVKKEDLDGLIKAIIKVTEDRSFSCNACLTKAEEFNQDICFKRYIDLYTGIVK